MERKGGWQVKTSKMRESGVGERRFACKTRNMIVDWVGKGEVPACSSGTTKHAREKEKARKRIKEDNERR